MVSQTTVLKSALDTGMQTLGFTTAAVTQDTTSVLMTAQVVMVSSP